MSFWSIGTWYLRSRVGSAALCDACGCSERAAEPTRLRFSALAIAAVTPLQIYREPSPEIERIDG